MMSMPKLGRERDEALEVGGSVRGRRDLAAARAGSASARMKLLEAGRLGHEQEARLLRADEERVRDLSRPVDERAGGGDDRLAADPEGQLALDHVEPLVLAVVDVQRRAAAARGEVLGHRDAAAGLLAGRLDRGEAAEEPQRLALPGPSAIGARAY